MTRPMPECSVTRRKSAAHIADIAEVFLVSVKDGLNRCEGPDATVRAQRYCRRRFGWGAAGSIPSPGGNTGSGSRRPSGDLQAPIAGRHWPRAEWRVSGKKLDNLACNKPSNQCVGINEALFREVTGNVPSRSHLALVDAHLRLLRPWRNFRAVHAGVAAEGEWPEKACANGS